MTKILKFKIAKTTKPKQDLVECESCGYVGCKRGFDDACEECGSRYLSDVTEEDK